MSGSVEITERHMTVEVQETGNVTVEVRETPVEVEIALVGPQGATGPAGPQGPAGVDGGGVIELVAGEALGGHRAVVANAAGEAVYADNADPAHRYGALGVTGGAVVMGATATVHVLGTITEPSWSWTPQQLVFVGAGGVLTQTPPTAPAWLRVVGTALSPTTLFVRPDPPITLV